MRKLGSLFLLLVVCSSSFAGIKQEDFQQNFAVVSANIVRYGDTTCLMALRDQQSNTVYYVSQPASMRGRHVFPVGSHNPGKLMTGLKRGFLDIVGLDDKNKVKVYEYHIDRVEL